MLFSIDSRTFFSHFIFGLQDFLLEINQLLLSFDENHKQQSQRPFSGSDFAGGRPPAFDEQSALQGLRQLDPQVITIIHNYYYADIYRFAHYRLNNQDVAEDITAEVFMQLLEAVKKGGGPQKTLRGWLMSTASNMVNDHYRKSYRRKIESLSETLHADTPGPMGRLEIHQRKEAVRAAMQKLTPDQQNILSLRFGAGYSLEETAESIGKNVNAVKQLQFRALASLRRHLGEEVL